MSSSLARKQPFAALFELLYYDVVGAGVIADVEIHIGIPVHDRRAALRGWRNGVGEQVTVGPIAVVGGDAEVAAELVIGLDAPDDAIAVREVEGRRQIGRASCRERV